jgi:hypothetical protein
MRDRRKYFCDYSGETRDEAVPHVGNRKRERVDLGLAILQCVALPGENFTLQDIAAWAGCTREAIYQIERSARRKIGEALRGAGVTTP